MKKHTLVAIAVLSLILLLSACAGSGGTSLLKDSVTPSAPLRIHRRTLIKLRSS